MQQFKIGTVNEYLQFSDHMPLVFNFSLGLKDSVEKSITKGSVLEEIIANELVVEKTAFEKPTITPELLVQEYLLKIDNEIATVEEIEEAIKYIKTLRVMRNL